MTGKVLLTCFFFGVLVVSSHASTEQDTKAIIDMIDKQIDMAETDKEKAKLCCYKARNHRKLNQPDLAEQDYLEALELAYTGWILNEYSNFLYKAGEYERAYKAASKVIEDFPHLHKEASITRDKAKAKYDEEYLAAHPPTIILDSVVDPNRVTRHDLIRKQNASRRARVVKTSSVSIPPPAKTTRRT